MLRSLRKNLIPLAVFSSLLLAGSVWPFVERSLDPEYAVEAAWVRNPTYWGLKYRQFYPDDFDPLERIGRDPWGSPWDQSRQRQGFWSPGPDGRLDFRPESDDLLLHKSERISVRYGAWIAFGLSYLGGVGLWCVFAGSLLGSSRRVSRLLSALAASPAALASLGLGGAVAFGWGITGPAIRAATEPEIGLLRETLPLPPELGPAGVGALAAIVLTHWFARRAEEEREPASGVLQEQAGEPPSSPPGAS